MSKKSNDIWRFQNKCLVLWHYSAGKLCCSECGNDKISHLTLDHVNGGGNQHRKSLMKQPSGTEFITWIIKNDFPDGFQVLCFGCNCAKKALPISREAAITAIQNRLKIEEIPITLSGIIKMTSYPSLVSTVAPVHV